MSDALGPAALRGWAQRALTLAGRFAAPETESDEARGERAALLIATVSMTGFAALWALLYAGLGRWISASIPGSYAVLTLASLAGLAATGRIEAYRISQILLILVLPFGVHASLGGFAQGSAVVLWGFLPVVGALIFHSRHANAWLAAYLVGLVVMGVLDARLRAAVAPLSPRATEAFWVGNLGGIAFVVFLVMRHFISYVVRQRRVAQEALRVVAAQTEELAKARARLEDEVEVARRIQLAMLPSAIDLARADVAASMVPASEVGGDYFDVRPAGRACWLAIGDVSGHGLTAGLIAMMVQSVVATLIDADPMGSPAAVVAGANRVLFESVHERLGKDAFVTFTALRLADDGALVCAGAHEPIVVWRARARCCEVISVPGPWLAVVPDVTRMVQTTALRLEPEDVVVLHTDGVTEAMDPEGHPFGLSRLVACVEADGDRAPAALRDRILASVGAWSAAQTDDRTVLVLRHRGRAT